MCRNISLRTEAKKLKKEEKQKARSLDKERNRRAKDAEDNSGQGGGSLDIFIKDHWIIILFTLAGGSLFVWQQYKQNCCNPWLSIFGSIGELVAVGGVFSFLLTYKGFTQAFQRALQKVIYTPDMLRHRDDLTEIWKTVSKELFDRKFTALQAPLLNIINEKYFPQYDTSCYYQDLKQVYYIRIKDKQDNSIEVVEYRNLSLMAENENGFQYDMVSRTQMATPSLTASDYFSHHYFKLDGVEIEEPHEINPNGRDAELRYKVDLSGKTTYRIEQEFAHRQDLGIDNFICFRAKYMIHKMDVEIKYDSSEIDVDFYCNGTLNLFETISDVPGSKRYYYDGLILNKQGYLFTIRIK